MKRTVIQRLTVLMVISSCLFAQQKLKPIAVKPPGTTEVITVEQLQLDIEVLQSQLIVSEQNVEIANLPNVMEARLKLARALQKAQLKAKAEQNVPKK